MTEVLEAALRAVRSGQAAALVTIVATTGATPRKAGARMLVYGDGRLLGSVGGGALESSLAEQARSALRSGRPELSSFELSTEATGPDGLACGGTVQAFIEPLEPVPTLVLLGAGHVSAAVARLAHPLGFRVEVADDRAEQASAERFPTADRLVVEEYGSAASRLSLGPGTYAVVATRGFASDTEALGSLIGKGLPFVGLLGSRTKAEKIFAELSQRGASPEHLREVRTPLGLPIGATTPDEIALSIVAELVSVRRAAKTS